MFSLDVSQNDVKRQHALQQTQNTELTNVYNFHFARHLQITGKVHPGTGHKGPEGE